MVLNAFQGGVPLVVRLVAYQTSQNAGNNRNDKANADTFFFYNNDYTQSKNKPKRYTTEPRL